MGKPRRMFYFTAFYYSPCFSFLKTIYTNKNTKHSERKVAEAAQERMVEFSAAEAQ